MRVTMTIDRQDDIDDVATRARSGDRNAFDALVGPLRSRLAAQVRARMGTRALADLEPDDVVQAAFLEAYTSIGRLDWRGEAAFYRWLASIAEHLIWKANERAARAGIALDEDPADDSSPAASALSREERARRLEKALEDLSPDHLEVIVLSRLEGLRIADVASRMGRSSNAVKKLLARALDELRRRFGDTTGSLRLPDRPLEIGRPSHAE
jgi:RNA polymerase sigma-70 factor (ECF subfamily)